MLKSAIEEKSINILQFLFQCSIKLLKIANFKPKKLVIAMSVMAPNKPIASKSKLCLFDLDITFKYLFWYEIIKNMVINRMRWV